VAFPAARDLQWLGSAEAPPSPDFHALATDAVIDFRSASSALLASEEGIEFRKSPRLSLVGLSLRRRGS